MNAFLSNIPEQNEEQDDKRIRKLQNVASVVVRQIKDQVDINFTLFGMPFQILKFVAIVRAVDITPTMVIYKIEDHTGSIRALWWLENENDSSDLPKVDIGKYVILFGCLRLQGREKVIAILHLEPTNDCNVITTHLLEAIRIRLEAEVKSKEIPNIRLANNPCAALATSMNFLEEDTFDEQEPVMNKLQLKVIQTLHSLDKKDPHGIYVEEVFKCFPPYQIREVRQALQCLLEEGYAYTTIDDFHVKLTSMM